MLSCHNHVLILQGLILHFNYSTATMMKKYIYPINFILVFSFIMSCNVLDQEPEFQIATSQAFANETNATAAVNGLYNEAQLIYNWRSQTLGELASDLVQSIDTWDAFNVIDEFRLTPDNTEVDDLYTQSYRVIDVANNIIAFVPDVPEMSDELKDDFLGQAYGFRGMVFFELARYFGGIPGVYGELGVVLPLEPSIGVTEASRAARASLEATYSQILEDLLQAEALLPEARANNFLTRSRLVKSSVRGMLARVHLYLGNYAEAENYANLVLNNGSYQLVPNFADAFRTDFSEESVFEMHYNNVDFSGFRQWYYPASLGGRGGICFHEEFAEEILARVGEDDRSDLIALNPTPRGDVYFPTKFDELQNASNVPVIRTAEMYLIRGEARAMQGNITDGVDDLNAVRNRAGLDDAQAAGQEVLVDLILEERKFEFAAEGHRYFDMARTGRAVEVFSNLERTNGTTTYSIGNINRILFPIPNSELLTNPNMEQNVAYR